MSIAALSNPPGTSLGKTLPLPNLRPARFDDYPQIQKLESLFGLLSLSDQDWRAIWLDNPLRARLGESWPIGWVLEEASGLIVGSLANIPSRYCYRGHELIAATGRGWVVMPEYRGVALWLMDEYFNQPGADLFINTTVNSMAVDPFSAFGSVRVPLGDWESRRILDHPLSRFRRHRLAHQGHSHARPVEVSGRHRAKNERCPDRQIFPAVID